jgi:hypothetical protein
MYLPSVHACSESEYPAESSNRSYSGLWDRQFERSAFILSPTCTVWLEGNLADACAAVGGCNKGTTVKMRLTVSGRFSPSTGHYGHMGMYEREIVVERVISAALVRD